MARIRTIKPQFWSSPGVASMTPLARLAFIAMWNWADDFGRGTYEPRELMGFIFPREDDMTVSDFRTLVGEIHLHVDVMFYSAGGRHFYEIGTWRTHQKVDPRFKESKHPAPHEGRPINPIDMEPISTPQHPDQQVSETHPPVGVFHPQVDVSGRSEGAGRGEEGKRGRGEQGLKDLSGSNEPDDNPKPTNPTPPPKKKQQRHDYSPEFEEFWGIWPNARGASKFETSKKFATALKVASAETIIEGARRFAADPNLDEDFSPMPTTWLHNRRWESGPLPAKKNQAQSKKPYGGVDAWLGITNSDDYPSQDPFGPFIDHEEFP